MSSRVFDVFDLTDEKINIIEFQKYLYEKGIYKTNPRLKEFKDKISANKMKVFYTEDEFKEVIKDNSFFIDKIMRDDFVIPHFDNFTKSIKEIYSEVHNNVSGEKATYIPQLSKQDENNFGVSICTIDGQQFNIGDTQTNFCIQSCCKPINYCIALEDNGEDFVHKYVGREPSGEQFNALKLNTDGKPHNPLINSGAIMTCSMIGREKDASERFDYVIDKWSSLSGNQTVGFDNSVCLSEKKHADRNKALAYFMNESNGFPDGTSLDDVLNFYFECCSITSNSNKMSIVASTLANGGINPMTGERIFSDTTVRDCLSLMNSCGMYNYSGEFAFKIGLPAKSGVAGGIFLVIPNVMGICTFSPKLDKFGNSVRGIDFFTRLVDKFAFHNFDNLVNTIKKEDPRMNIQQKVDIRDVIEICALGDLNSLKYYQLKEIDFGEGDYDGRTPLHLACSNGHVNIVKHLIEHCSLQNIHKKDRWGNTPLDDAKREEHKDIIDYITSLEK
jgi:glutaminase